MIRLAHAPAAGIVPGYDWSEGDAVIAIGETPLRDILDFYYLSEEAGDLDLTIVDPQNVHRSFRVRSSDLNTLAESFAPMEFKTCAAQCVFCFIDQNPAGMRDNIYVKDEDYRFSFLYGNYITLTSLGRRGIERVIEQRLSPLYVSVHATDIDARTRLLGIKRRIDVMEILRHLTSHGIEIHAQIVLCPEWNDGAILSQSLDDLGTLHPALRSISVVPVGLSDHREGLPVIRPVTVEDAVDAVRRIEDASSRFGADLGTPLAYASDEFYLMLDRPFPTLDFSGDLLQQDTGIGMCRELIEDLNDALEDLQAASSRPRSATLLTGTLAARFMEQQLRPLLDRIGWLDIEIVAVENRLYGAGITVAGLVSGGDLQRAIEGLAPKTGPIWLPRVAINHDGLFLDELTVEDLGRVTSREIVVPEEGLVEALFALAEED